MYKNISIYIIIYIAFSCCLSCFGCQGVHLEVPVVIDVADEDMPTVADGLQALHRCREGDALQTKVD